MADRQLKVTILGDDKTKDAFGSVGDGTDGLGGKFGKLGLAAAAGFAAVAAAAAAAGVALFKIGEDFHAAYSTIIVGTGASGDALEGLKDDFRAVAASVPASLGDVGTAIADLNTRTGATGADLQNLAGRMLDLSRITGTDLSENIASITRVFGDWGISTADQAGAMDKLFVASQSTGIGVSELASTVVQFGAPLRQLGYSFEESAALLGKWEKEGVNSEAVLAGLKIGLGNFSKAGKEPKEALEAVTAAIKGAGSAGEANQLAIEAFGKRAGPDMAAAVREGRFELGDLITALDNSGGSIDDAASRTEGFGEKWQHIKNVVLLGLEPLATAVFGAVADAMDSIAPIVERVSGRLSGLNTDVFPALMNVVNEVKAAITAWVEENGDQIQQWGDTIQSIAATIVEIITGLLQIIEEVWRRYGDTILSYVGATFGNILQLIGGVMTTIRGVIDLVLGLMTGDWQRAWDGIKEIFGGVWTAIEAILKQALNAMQTYLRAVWATIGKQITDAWDGIVADFHARWELIIGVVTDGVGAVKGAVEAIVGAVTGAFRRAWQGANDATSGGVGAVLSLMTGMPQRILAAIGDLGRLLYDQGARLIRGLIEGITSKLPDLKDTLGSVTSLIPDWKGPADKDARLLRPAGRSIMGGLVAGIEESTPSLRRTLSDITDLIGLQAGGTAYALGRFDRTSRPPSVPVRPSMTSSRRSGRCGPTYGRSRRVSVRRSSAGSPPPARSSGRTDGDRRPRRGVGQPA